MEPKKGPGRPKKEPEFSQAEPWAYVMTEKTKFISQGDAYFSYAEAVGVFDAELMQRKLEPPPRFICFQADYVLQEKMDKYKEARVRATKEMTELETLEFDLRKEGLLEERTST